MFLFILLESIDLIDIDLQEELCDFFIVRLFLDEICVEKLKNIFSKTKRAAQLEILKEFRTTYLKITL